MLVGTIEDLPPPLTTLSTTGLLSDEDPRTVERVDRRGVCVRADQGFERSIPDVEADAARPGRHGRPRGRCADRLPLRLRSGQALRLRSGQACGST